MVASSKTDSAPISGWYDQPFPDWIEHNLERRYSYLYSTLACIRAFNPDATLHAFVSDGAGADRDILIFDRSNDVVTVHCGGPVKADTIATFTKLVFQRNGSARVVCLNPVATSRGQLVESMKTLDLPYQIDGALSDIVTRLPESVEEFRKRLGQGTRSQIKRSLAKIKDTSSFTVLRGDDISAEIFSDIYNLHRKRFDDVGRISIKDEAAEEKMFLLARRYGVVAVLRIDGGIAAGVIGYEVASSCAFETIAHDPAHNRLGVGMVCLYLLMCDCIEHGLEEFNFLWGEVGYKYRLTGKKRELCGITIYRSRAAALMHARRALGIAAKLAVHSLKGRATQSPALEKGISSLRSAARHLRSLRQKPGQK